MKAWSNKLRKNNATQSPLQRIAPRPKTSGPISNALGAILLMACNGPLDLEEAGSQSDVEDASSELVANDPSVRGGNWADYSDTIPVCWKNSGFEDEKMVIASAIAESWGEKSDLRFVWHGECPNSSDLYLSVRITDEYGASACKKSPTGMRAANDTEASCRFRLGGASLAGLYGLAAHEFGHMIGFDHEHQHPEAGPQTSATPNCVPSPTAGSLYPVGHDPWSTMSYSYCLPTGRSKLRTPSGQDLLGLQMLYGAPSDWKYKNRNFCTGANDLLWHGDWNGDGGTDLLCANKATGDFTYDFADEDGEFNGTDFYDSGRSFCVASNQTPYFGDFNGDGRDDILCQQSDGRMFVELANASGQFVSTNWNQYRNYCYRGSATELMFVGDFNGDGRDDLLCNYRNGNMSIALAESGGTFATATDWLYYGRYFCRTSSERMYVGDFNGDGRDDLVCIQNDGDMLVEHAASNYFSGSDWSGRRDFCDDFANHELYVADFNGDRRDDLLCRRNNEQEHFVLELADEDSGVFNDYARSGAPQFDGIGNMGKWCKSQPLVVGPLNQLSRTAGRPAFASRADILCNDGATGMMSAMYDLIAPTVSNREMSVPPGGTVYIGPVEVPEIANSFGGPSYFEATALMNSYTGQMNMYLRQGAWPTTTSYDCADLATSDSMGKCSVSGAGDLYIMLRNAGASSATDVGLDVFVETLGAVAP